MRGREGELMRRREGEPMRGRGGVLNKACRSTSGCRLILSSSNWYSHCEEPSHTYQHPVTELCHKGAVIDVLQLELLRAATNHFLEIVSILLIH